MSKSFEKREGWIWMNGQFIPWANATSHIISQGLHYASAVFEGERAYNGKIFKSEEHTNRFFNSAKIIGINIPFTKDEINALRNKAKEDFPLPERPVITTNLFLGMIRSTFFKLCDLAP